MKKSAKCHPRVTSILFWQIISHYKIVVNIPCLQNICSVVKILKLKLLLVSVGLFSPCLVFNLASSFMIDNERQINNEIIWYIEELLTYFFVKGHLLWF